MHKSMRILLSGWFGTSSVHFVAWYTVQRKQVGLKEWKPAGPGRGRGVQERKERGEATSC